MEDERDEAYEKMFELEARLKELEEENGGVRLTKEEHLALTSERDQLMEQHGQAEQQLKGLQWKHEELQKEFDEYREKQEASKQVEENNEFDIEKLK